jgi:hypothetical protein
MDEELKTILLRIEEKIDNLTAAHSATVTQVDSLVKAVEPHIAEIAPMIDAIANNPMFRMMTGGKKK